MMIESCQSRSNPYHARVGIHERYATRSKTTAGFAHRLKTKHCVELVRLQNRTRRSARNKRLEFMPFEHAAAVFFQKLTNRDATRCFVHTRPIDRTGNTVQLRSTVFLNAHRRKPLAAALNNKRNRRDRFHVVHDRWSLKQTDNGRKRWLHPRLAGLAFQTFDQTGFFTADIRATTGMNVDIEVKTRFPKDIFPEITLCIRFLNGVLQSLNRNRQLAAHENVAIADPQRPGRDHAALNMTMWIKFHQITIFKRTRLTFVSIDDEVFRNVRFFGQKAPFDSTRESCTAAAAQIGFFYFIDDRVAVHRDGFAKCLIAAVFFKYFDGVRVWNVEMSTEKTFFQHDLPTFYRRHELPGMRRSVQNSQCIFAGLGSDGSRLLKSSRISFTRSTLKFSKYSLPPPAYET